MEHKDYTYLSAAEFDSYHDMGREGLDKVNRRHKEKYKKRMLNYSLGIHSRSYQGVTENRNIVVVSKTGDGKSSTANTILGRKAFKVSSSSNSSTLPMSVESCNYKNRTIKVVDTPGIQHTSQDTSDIFSDIKRKAFELDGGINCFAICLSASDTRCTDATLQIIEMFKKSESDDRDILNYCILIFTKAETELNDFSLEAFVNGMKESEKFKDFVNGINHRVIAVNNNTDIPAEQERNREEIIAIVDELVEDNRQNGRSGIYKNKLHEKVDAIAEGSGIPYPRIFANAAVDTLIALEYFNSKSIPEDLTPQFEKLIVKLGKCEISNDSKSILFTHDNVVDSDRYVGLITTIWCEVEEWATAVDKKGSPIRCITKWLLFIRNLIYNRCESLNKGFGLIFFSIAMIIIVTWFRSDSAFCDIWNPLTSFYDAYIFPYISSPFWRSGECAKK